MYLIVILSIKKKLSNSKITRSKLILNVGNMLTFLNMYYSIESLLNKIGDGEFEKKKLYLHKLCS